MEKQKKFSHILKYKPLSNYEGLEGRIPCRAKTTYVGIEVELEGVRTKHSTPSSWKTVEDGSLKIDGVEFVTIPIKFCYLEKELERLFGSLHTSTISSRCSIHVHMNARDFTMDELYVFLILYIIFERSLYRLSGDRWNNIFCVPLTTAIEKVASVIKDITNGIPLHSLYWWKYLGVNLSNLSGN